MQIISREFLDSFGVKPGQELVLYSVADRKVYFFHRDETDFRLKLVRGKRRLPIKVRPTDIRVRINFDGTISRGEEVNELIVEE